MRTDGRTNDQMRELKIERNYTKYAEGSVLVSYGETKVLCTATIDDFVPHFMRDQGKGWLTAEYALLPSSTHTRARRESAKGKLSGRTMEIQRLIGRSLRSAINFEKLGERTITIDADVLQADGGTRTAAITGGMIALHDGINKLLKEGRLDVNPIETWIAAVSVGILNQEMIVDLCYEEDYKAEVDMNIVMTDKGEFIEVQGTAEERPYTATQLQAMLTGATTCIGGLIEKIKHTVDG